MSNSSENKSENIKNWLKNLSQESWQLELIVSAFTIFLLIGGQQQYNDFYELIPFNFDVQSPSFGLIYLFLGMISLSIKILLFCLISHLLLRGFWIGTIGLRSVQDHLKWNRLNYSSYFTEKLKRSVYSLDDLVIQLDEICSVIFSFSFLLISILLSFGLTILVGGSLEVLFQGLTNYFNGTIAKVISNVSNGILIIYVFGAFIYMIDFFSLGFIKKVNWISRVYYPIYRIFGFITLAPVTRSIYYHLISRFTKNKIRIVYFLAIGLFLLSSLTSINHRIFFSSANHESYLSNGFYEESLNNDDNLISKVSVPSKVIKSKYVPLFIRYNPNDNSLLSEKCPDFKDLESELMKWNISFSSNNSGIEIQTEDNSQMEDKSSEKKLKCLGSLYRISINKKSIQNPNFLFYNHPLTNQNGILLMISSKEFQEGKNDLLVEKISAENFNKYNLFAHIRLWK